MRIVITGAGRGIGLELTRQYLARGDAVDAAVRDPARATELQALRAGSAGVLRVQALDVRSDASVASYAEALPPGPVDLLINNAGVMGELSGLEGLDFDDVRETFEVNAIGPLRLVRALLPRLRDSGVRKIAHITSKMGSIDDNTSGGAYGYRMSKAALNMASRSLSIDLGRDGIMSVVLNPGWVQTDMGGRGAPTPVEASVEGLIAQIDALTPDRSGRFFDFRGAEVPW